MRDAGRLREKVEFSLDERQVWALALSALLLLAGVFTVGLLIGRRTTPPPLAAPGDLAAMDRAAAKEKPGQPTAPPQAAQAPGSGLRAPGPETQAPGSGLQAPGPEPKEAAGEPGPNAGKLAEKPNAGKATPPKAAAVVPGPRSPTVVPAPPKPVEIASATPVALTPPPRDVGEFTVQIGASQDRAEALRMEHKARAAGLKPYVVEANLGSKGTWYRVRVGAFKDKDAATRYRQDVERELRGPAVVMPSH